MESFLRGKGCPRTLRLFACACCRRIQAWLADPRSRRAVDVAERYADGAVGEYTLEAAWRQADQAASEIDDATGEDGDFRPYNTTLAAHWAAVPWSDTSGVVSVASHAAFYALRAADPVPESSAQGHLLADILGGPGSRTCPDPVWLTSTVTAMAEGIYRDGAFDRLPILADALEEAGCDRPDILTHCRGDGHHVRGCWVVDLVLAKR